MVQVEHETLCTGETVALTDQGPVRERNEDSVAVVGSSQDPEKGTLLIVADGMGGYTAGDVASRMVTAELPDLYFENTDESPLQSLVGAIHTMNDRIFKAATEAKKTMGSTVVATALKDSRLITVNVGDSRAYLFRDRVLHRLTKDHSLSNDAFGFFSIKSRFSYSHVLTQALGPRPQVSPHTNSIEAREDDIVLLCSDGLTSVVSDETIHLILSTYPMKEAASVLMSTAKKNKADDNISILLLTVIKEAPIGQDLSGP